MGAEIAHLRSLDLKGLRPRWQSVFQRPTPDHLHRHLLFSIIPLPCSRTGVRQQGAEVARGGVPEVFETPQDEVSFFQIGIRYGPGTV
jgi:hypothetical protein